MALERRQNHKLFRIFYFFYHIHFILPRKILEYYIRTAYYVDFLHMKNSIQFCHSCLAEEILEKVGETIFFFAKIYLRIKRWVDPDHLLNALFDEEVNLECRVDRGKLGGCIFFSIWVLWIQTGKKFHDLLLARIYHLLWPAPWFFFITPMQIWFRHPCPCSFKCM